MCEKTIVDQCTPLKNKTYKVIGKHGLDCFEDVGKHFKDSFAWGACSFLNAV